LHGVYDLPPIGHCVKADRVTPAYSVAKTVAACKLAQPRVGRLVPYTKKKLASKNGNRQKENDF